jgi:hypothetical protein
MLLLLLSACATDDAPTQALAVSDAELIEVFEDLHRPVYQVYELSPDERDALHDLLASSFDGEALTAEYVEHFTTLAMLERESTSIDVRRVDYERIDVLERGPDWARVEADWSVGGVVTHLQHKHTRVNRYVAVYELRDGPDGLRITETRMRDLQRVRGVLSSMASEDGFLGDQLPSSGGGFMSPSDLFDAGFEVDDGTEPALTDTAPPDDAPVETLSLDDLGGLLE